MKDVIWITRPEDQAVDLAYALNEKGYRVFCEEVLRIEPLQSAIPDLKGYDALIFTSANGVNVFAAQSAERGLPAYAVRVQTAKALKNADFETVHTGKGMATDLLAFIDNKAKNQKFLHIRGEMVAQQMQSDRNDIESLIVYRSAMASELSENCRYLLQSGAITRIVFFSKRSAEAFTALIQKYGGESALQHCEALCLGDSMVESIKILDWKAMRIAQTPNRQGLLNLLE